MSNVAIREIIEEFEAAFVEVRRTIFEQLNKERDDKEPDEISFTKGSRSADIITGLDREASRAYLKVAAPHNMFVMSEERDDSLKNIALGKCDYVLILDAIDGTNNMLSNLPFGVNIAVGTVKGDVFRIGDIDAVFVADYSTLKSFRWIRGDDAPRITDARLHDGDRELVRPTTGYTNIFEVPDEYSYVPREDEEAPARQAGLLQKFRTIFPHQENQRRAVDCTGLQLLEVYSGNLKAYGDMRRATKLWDALPSIRLLLETNLHVMNGKLEPYAKDDPVLDGSGGGIEVKRDLTAEIIVLDEWAFRAVRENEETFNVKDPLADATYDIYISYNDTDVEKAEILKNRLKELGLKCFFAMHDIDGGDAISPEVREGLLKSREVCLLATKEAAASKWVPVELGAAWILDRRITPVLYDGEVKFKVLKKKLPDIVSDVNAIELENLHKFVERFNAKWHPGSS